MRKFDVKQLVICVLAVLAPRLCVAGAYPLVPALFMTGYLSGVNRSLIFLCTVGGLLVLAPLRIFLKYGLAVLLAALLVKAVELGCRKCKTAPAAIIAGGTTAAVTVVWQMMKIPDASTVAIGILEGVFVFCFVFLGTRLCYLFLDWEPLGRQPMPVYVQGGEKLNEYAQSFQQLAKTFRQMNRYRSDFTAEELGRMQNEVTGTLCVSCSQCAACWETEDTPMYQLLYRFLQSVQKGEDTEDSARDLGEHCVCMEEMMEQVTRVFEKAHLNMAWYNRLQENRDAIAQQLNAMAYIMEDCAKNEQDVTALEGKLTAAVRYALKENGVVCDSLRLLRKSGEKLEILFSGHTRGRQCVSVKELAKIISRASGHPFLPSQDARALLGEKGGRLSFLETTELTAYYGVARAVREGEQVSGDSFAFRLLDDGRCIMVVSDGMGSGYSACKESEMVIDLIEKFMESGFRPDTALQMMNSAMVTHGENNLFSTVDLACIDMDSGKGKLYKVGAAATFVRRGDQVTWIEDHSMPVGVFMNQVPGCEEISLKDGDFIVMVTDGTLDHLYVDDARETMADIIRSVDTSNPSRFSRQVLEQVLLFTGGRVRDDMTVLTAGIWKRQPGESADPNP